MAYVCFAIAQKAVNALLRRKMENVLPLHRHQLRLIPSRLQLEVAKHVYITDNKTLHSPSALSVLNFFFDVALNMSLPITEKYEINFHDIFIIHFFQIATLE